jgi:hypothetical protein
MKSLSPIEARPTFLNHGDDATQVAVCTSQRFTICGWLRANLSLLEGI